MVSFNDNAFLPATVCCFLLCLTIVTGHPTPSGSDDTTLSIVTNDEQIQDEGGDSTTEVGHEIVEKINSILSNLSADSGVTNNFNKNASDDDVIMKIDKRSDAKDYADKDNSTSLEDKKDTVEVKNVGEKDKNSSEEVNAAEKVDNSEDVKSDDKSFTGDVKADEEKMKESSEDKKVVSEDSKNQNSSESLSSSEESSTGSLISDSKPEESSKVTAIFDSKMDEDKIMEVAVTTDASEYYTVMNSSIVPSVELGNSTTESGNFTSSVNGTLPGNGTETTTVYHPVFFLGTSG